MAAMLTGMTNKYVQFVRNLFAAISQCMLSTNISTLAIRSKYLFTKLLIINQLIEYLYYLSAFFAIFVK